MFRYLFILALFYCALLPVSAMSVEHSSDWPIQLIKQYAESLRQEAVFLSKQYIPNEEINTKAAEEIYASAKQNFQKSHEKYEALFKHPPENLEPWMKTIGHRDSLSSKEALEYLHAFYPLAKRLDSYTWQAIREIFGIKTQELFLRETYEVKELSLSQQRSQVTRDFTILLVKDPFYKMNTSAIGRNWQNFRPFFQRSALGSDAVNSGLAAQYQVQIYEASAFAELDQVAEEFGNFLDEDKKRNSKPLLIVSTGESSAILHRYFEMNPAQRKNSHILAWVNLNGRLHGLPLSLMDRKSTRSLASAEEDKSPANKLENNMLKTISKMQEERSIGNVSLGDGFAIYNVLHWNEKERASPDIQDSLIGDAQSYLIIGPQTKQDLGKILYSLGY